MSGNPPASLGLAVTLGAFLVGRRVSAWANRQGWPPVLHPVAFALVAGLLYVRLTGINFAAYQEQTRPLTFLLGLAIVALALPLHEQADVLRARRGFWLGASVSCAVFSAVSGWAVARGLGWDQAGHLALMTRGATSPLAMSAGEAVHLSPSGVGLAGATAVFCGLIGGIIGPWLLNWLGVQSPLARGLALGAVATGVGTARALEEGEETGGAAAIALGLVGVLTVILAPLLGRYL